MTWERVVAERTFRLTAAPVDSDLGTVLSGIVVAVDVSEERRNERSWVALHSIAREVARKASPNDIAALIAHTLQDVFAVDITAIVRFTGPGSGEILAMAPQHLETLGRTVSFAVGDASAIARVAETGHVSTVRYVTSGGPLSEAITAAGMQVGAAAPIHSQGELWGAIVLASSLADGLTDDVVARLASFADLVELAVGNSAAWSALSREAATDELTGLPNRRSFYEQLRREIERAQRHQRPLSVVLMDIDHFKAVNDRFGHHAGDRVLAELGTLMRQVKREGELMARIGGEEFGWIVPETDGDAAMGAAERLRTAVGSETFSSVGEMTMSAGVCSLSQVADLDALVGGADQALYAAKREGRNRTSRFQTRSDDRS